MGYIIRVNHKVLSDAAKKAKSFVAFNKAKMKSLDNRMIIIKSDWKGADADALISKWLNASSKYSAIGKLNTAMKNYAKCVEVASAKYKRAQADAVNRARKLW